MEARAGNSRAHSEEGAPVCEGTGAKVVFKATALRRGLIPSLPPGPSCAGVIWRQFPFGTS